MSSDETIACDPLMCAALRAHGVATSRLLPLAPTASGATGADVVVASPSARTQDSPALIASADGRGGSAGLAAALALVRAQHAPYQPAQVTTVRLAGDQAGLRIDFAAPSPLGLLTGGARG